MDIESGEHSGSFVNCVLVAASFGIGMYLLRRFVKGAQFTERVSAKGKVAVVTGANSGIGYETVRALNLAKAKVYMLCRSEVNASDAKVALVKSGCDISRLIFVECDLANFESIRKAASDILAHEQQIDILINNAGIMFYPKFELTVDGHEMTWQCNHLGPFLLTELLLPALKNSPSARIVNVSSKLHLNSPPIDLSIVDDKKGFDRFVKPYNRSKLANVMHARELTNRLQKEGSHNVTINALHPGVVGTSLSRNLFIEKEPLRTIFSPLKWFFMKTPRDGAQTSLYLALSKKVEGVSGKYFSDCALAVESPHARDAAACDNLYNYSLEQTKQK